MPIYISGKKIVGVYSGTRKVKSVSVGTRQVWSSKLTPASLGASNWLDFTDGLTDKGSAPQTWTSNGQTISGGYLPAPALANMNPAVAPVDQTQPISWTCWFQPTGTSTVMNSYIAAQMTYCDLSIDLKPSDRTLRWWRRHGATANTSVTTGTAATGWNFAACVMEPVSGTTWRHRAYLNGTELFNTTWNAGTQSAITSATFRANYSTNSANADDFALYPAALTAAQITALYQAGRTT